MQIASSNLIMASTENRSQKWEQQESLEIIIRDSSPMKPTDTVSISQAAMSCKCEKDQKIQESAVAINADRQHDLKALLVEILSGKEICFLSPDDIMKTNLDEDVPVDEPDDPEDGIGIIYRKESEYREAENVVFASKGIINTVDGREIAFALKLEMEREFIHRNAIDIRIGDPALTDPLVVNFARPAAELSDLRFAFDLNADGVDDEMPALGVGSGYLALDVNEDGRINNGMELFGPASGDGFEELSQYDTDGNRWIDEADPIHDRLRIWIIGEDNQDRIDTLADQGIGAIYLGRVGTAFDLKDPKNELQGKVLQSGLFLKENGTAGSIQQLDLVV